MLFSPVFAKLHPRQSADYFSAPIPMPDPPSPNSHGIISFADPHHLNPIGSYRSTKGGGGRGAHSGRPFQPLAPRIQPQLFQSLAHSFARFCTCSKNISFPFMRLRTLCRNHPGWGVPMTDLFSPPPSQLGAVPAISVSWTFALPAHSLLPFAPAGRSARIRMEIS